MEWKLFTDVYLDMVRHFKIKVTFEYFMCGLFKYLDSPFFFCTNAKAKSLETSKHHTHTHT